jgi:acylphosphatase
MRIARLFTISGRVQGVGYRYFAQEAAVREGVTGYVKNLPDGRVEAYVEGEMDAVTRVERAIRSGPPGARVTNVEADAITPAGAYKSFRVTS